MEIYRSLWGWTGSPWGTALHPWVSSTNDPPDRQHRNQNILPVSSPPKSNAIDTDPYQNSATRLKTENFFSQKCDKKRISLSILRFPRQFAGFMARIVKLPYGLSRQNKAGSGSRWLRNIYGSGFGRQIQIFDLKGGVKSVFLTLLTLLTHLKRCQSAIKET